jgi:hypothetical protein
MPNRSRKPPADENQLAASIVARAIGEAEQKPEKPPEPEKNPAAVALGRLGGLKGGHARAKSLSAKKRREIATAAARARWKKAKKSRRR